MSMEFYGCKHRARRSRTNHSYQWLASPLRVRWLHLIVRARRDNPTQTLTIPASPGPEAPLRIH